MFNKILISVCLAVFAEIAEETLVGDQNRLCLKTKTYQDFKLVDKLVPESTTETSWCWNFLKGFRCRNHGVIYKRVKTPQVINRTKSFLTCCNGFIESDSKCIPHCSNGCVNGRCTDPDTCDCDSGFYGPICDQTCPPNRWGRKCLEECDCLNESECDKFNGRCICLPGWHGLRCESSCFEGYYGPNCQEKCDCYNDACDHVTGACRDVAAEKFFENVEVNNSILQTEIIPNSGTEEDIPLLETKGSTLTSFAFFSRTNDTSTTTEDSHPLKDKKAMEEKKATKLFIPASSTSMGSSEETISAASSEKNSTFFEESTESSTEKESSIEEMVTAKNDEPISITKRPQSREDEILGEENDFVTDIPITYTTSTSFSITTIKDITLTHETSVETKSNIEPMGRKSNDSTKNKKNNKKKIQNNKSENNLKWTSEENLLNVFPRIHSIQNEKNFSENFEKDVETIFRPFNTSRFIPSLSVLSGVTILIIIIGAWRLTLENKRKNQKNLAKKQNEIVKSKEGSKRQDNLIPGFSETAVYLWEIHLPKEKPSLQTFKPSPVS